jgi:hypothetical protein
MMMIDDDGGMEDREALCSLFNEMREDRNGGVVREGRRENSKFRQVNLESTLLLRMTLFHLATSLDGPTVCHHNITVVKRKNSVLFFFR